MKNSIILLFFVCLLTGCAAAPEPAAATTHPVAVEPVATTAETVPPEAAEAEAAVLVEEVPPPTGIVLEPEAPGDQEVRCDAAVVDYSHAEEGYIMVCHFAETDKRLKVLLKGPTTTYNYNLPQGQWVTFPLSDGDGPYQAGIYRNTEGTKYAMVMLAEFEVALLDEFAPFLRPNQYVNYLTAPNTVTKGAELCAGLDHPLDKVAAVYDYVVQNVTYDEEKAAAVQSGYLPDLDEILEIKKGICFDYAAMMTAMLRSQQVPCKLVVGYAGSVYHAWISVWTEEDGWIDGAIFFDGHMWKRMDPTFVSAADNREEILDYVEHGTYTVKYLY